MLGDRCRVSAEEICRMSFLQVQKQNPRLCIIGRMHWNGNLKVHKSTVVLQFGTQKALR